MRPPKIDVQLLQDRPQPVIMVKGILDPADALHRAREAASQAGVQLISPTTADDVVIKPTRAMPCRSLHGRVHNPPCRKTHYTHASPGRGAFPASFFLINSAESAG